MDLEIERRLSRRINDGELLTDVERSKFVMVYEVNHAEGTPLEDLGGADKTVVLYKMGWNHHYFMRYRQFWALEDYFAEAERRIKEKGIENP